MADTHDQSMERHGDCRGTKDRFKIPIDDQALGGDFPQWCWRDTPKLTITDLSAFAAQLKSSGEREISTTMAFVRILNTLLRNNPFCGIQEHRA